MTEPFDSLYALGDRDGVFGDLYNPAELFTYAKEVKIVTLRKECDDGQDVEIFETRCPARFYKICAAATPDREFEYLGVVPGKPAAEITTGSGHEMAALALRIARELSRGMLGIRAVR